MTGREGQASTRLMGEYGTNVVAGVAPGKRGQTDISDPELLGELRIATIVAAYGFVGDARL